MTTTNAPQPTAIDNMLTVSMIQRALDAKSPDELCFGTDFWLRPDSIAALVVRRAEQLGYISRYSHTQACWTEEGLAKARRELPAN